MWIWISQTFSQYQYDTNAINIKVIYRPQHSSTVLRSCIYIKQFRIAQSVFLSLKKILKYIEAPIAYTRSFRTYAPFISFFFFFINHFFTICYYVVCAMCCACVLRCIFTHFSHSPFSFCLIFLFVGTAFARSIQWTEESKNRLCFFFFVLCFVWLGCSFVYILQCNIWTIITEQKLKFTKRKNEENRTHNYSFDL